MPKAWSDKDERQYDEIKKQQRGRGRSQRRAKEIAARTVNKKRREEGRTKDSGSTRTSSGLEDRTKKELYDRAKQLDVEGRSRMSKDELIQAIRRRS